MGYCDEVVGGCEMVSDEAELIRELLLACSPALPGETLATHSGGIGSPLSADRLLIAVTVIRGLDRKALEDLACWLLGAASTLLRSQVGGEPSAYRRLIVGEL